MTSINSEPINNPFRVNFAQRLANGKKFTIFMTFLQIIGIPLVLFSEMSSLFFSGLSASYLLDTFVFIGVLNFAVATCSAIMIIINNFSYLFRRNEIDLYFSLPITRKQHFKSETLSGLIMYILPLLISFVVAMLEYVILYFVILSKKVQYDDMDYLLRTILSTYSCLFVIYLMFFGFLLLVALCCGRLFETATYPLLFAVALPLMLYLVIYSTFSSMNGIVIEKSYIYPIFFTSPIGGFVYYFVYFFDSADDNGRLYLLSFIQWALLSLLMTALYYFAAYRIYLRRSVESVGKPFAFRALLYIFECTVVFVVVNSQFLVTEELISEYTLGVVFLAAMAFVLIEALSNRISIKPIHSLIRFFSAITVSFALMLLMTTTDYLGMESYIPEEDKIQSVTLYTMGSFKDFTCKITDAEDIKKLTDFHRELSNSGKSSMRDSDYYNCMVGIQYLLDSGKTVSRKYFLDQIDSECAYELFTRDNISAQIIDSDLFDSDSEFYCYLNDVSDENYDNEVMYKVTYEQVNAICSSFVEDYRDMSYEEFQNCWDSKYYCMIRWIDYLPETNSYDDNSFMIDIPLSFDKTRAVLESLQ